PPGTQVENFVCRHHALNRLRTARVNHFHAADPVDRILGYFTLEVFIGFGYDTETGKAGAFDTVLHVDIPATVILGDEPGAGDRLNVEHHIIQADTTAAHSNGNLALLRNDRHPAGLVTLDNAGAIGRERRVVVRTECRTFDEHGVSAVHIECWRVAGRYPYNGLSYIIFYRLRIRRVSKGNLCRKAPLCHAILVVSTTLHREFHHTHLDTGHRVIDHLELFAVFVEFGHDCRRGCSNKHRRLVLRTGRHNGRLRAHHWDNVVEAEPVGSRLTCQFFQGIILILEDVRFNLCYRSARRNRRRILKVELEIILALVVRVIGNERHVSRRLCEGRQLQARKLFQFRNIFFKQLLEILAFRRFRGDHHRSHFHTVVVDVSLIDRIRVGRREHLQFELLDALYCTLREFPDLLRVFLSA